MPECTRTERILFKLIGSGFILVGLTLLGISGWEAWFRWVSVTRGPQTNAVLVSKDIFPKGGARLVFRYLAYGRTLTGAGFRWGSESSVRTALETYTPGTIHRIAYDPNDPRQVEPNLQDNWYPIRGLPTFLAIAAAFIGGGVFFTDLTGTDPPLPHAILIK